MFIAVLKSLTLSSSGSLHMWPLAEILQRELVLMLALSNLGVVGEGIGFTLKPRKALFPQGRELLEPLRGDGTGPWESVLGLFVPSLA